MLYELARYLDVGKLCRSCGKTKARSDFCTNVSDNVGLSRKCRECIQEYNRRYHLSHDITQHLRMRRWRAQNREYDLFRKRIWYKRKHGQEVTDSELQELTRLHPAIPTR